MRFTANKFPRLKSINAQTLFLLFEKNLAIEVDTIEYEETHICIFEFRFLWKNKCSIITINILQISFEIRNINFSNIPYEFLKYQKVKADKSWCLSKEFPHPRSDHSHLEKLAEYSLSKDSPIILI